MMLQHCTHNTVASSVFKKKSLKMTLYRNACFSLHQIIVPWYRNGYNYKVYYCFSYQLETCNKVHVFFFLFFFF